MSRLRNSLLAAVISCASFSGFRDLSGSEVAVPLSTPRISGLDLELPVGQEVVKLASRLRHDAAGRIIGEGTVDGAAVNALGKLASRRGVFSFSIVFRGNTEKVTLKVEGVVGAGSALASYSGPRGKVRRVPLPVSLAATLGAFAGTFDVEGDVDAKGKVTATGRFVSGFGNDPPGDGTLRGRIKKGTKITFRFKSGRQRCAFKGVRQGDFFVGVLKVVSPPAREVVEPFSLPAGFLLRFNPTVEVTRLESDRARVQLGASALLDWALLGIPTNVTLEPGSLDVRGSLSRGVQPFPSLPAGVDPRVPFKVTARDFATEDRGPQVLVCRRDRRAG